MKPSASPSSPQGQLELDTRPFPASAGPAPSAGSRPASAAAVATRSTRGATTSAAAASSLKIYADGACKGNPGPGGWGALLIGSDGEQEICGGEAQTTNNRMELTAVIEALAVAPEGSTIALYTDSRYVQQGMSEWIHGWKRKGWRTADGKPVKNVDLWQKLDASAARHHVSWHWVRGHVGDVGNERADALANRGILQAGRGAR